MISTGLGKWEFRVLSALGVAGLVLAASHIYLFGETRALREQVTARQQYINQSLPLSRLNNQMVQALASMSANTSDEQIKSLLAEHDITFTISAPEAGTESQ